MGKCGENKPGELCDMCKDCEKEYYSFIKHGCDSGCVYCPDSGCQHLHCTPEPDTPKKTVHIIRFVTTPKCKDCTPTKDMLRRRSCRGCVKYNAMKKERNYDNKV